MAKVICFANQKGGPGKTINGELAAKALAEFHKKKIMFFDSDGQGTIEKLNKNQSVYFPEEKKLYDYKVVSLFEIEDNLLEHMENYDYIFVDIPGILHSPDGEKEHLMSLFFYCDIIFMPICPSDSVIASSHELYEFLLELRQRKIDEGLDEMKIHPFVNLYEASDYDSKSLVANDYEELKAYGFSDIMKHYISKRVGYRRTHEKTPYSVAKSPFTDAAAKKEHKAFIKEVYSKIKDLN